MKTILRALKKDKSALLILLAVPLIVPFFLHFVFGQIYVEDVPFGVVDLDNSSLSRSVIQGLENHTGLSVELFTDSETELEQAIYNKKVNGGLIIPQDFSKDLSKNNTTKAALIVDGTNLLIGNNAAGYVSQVLGTYNAGVQMRILEGNGMTPAETQSTLTTFSYGERVLYEPYLSYISNLIYVVIPFVIQTYFLTAFALPALMEEKHFWVRHQMGKQEKTKRISFLVTRVLLVSVMVCVCSYLAFAFYANMRNMPLRGTFGKYFALLFVFLLAVTAISLVLTALFNEKNLIYFIEFYFIVSSVIIITSGAVWPEYMMPDGFATVIKTLWPFFHVALPIKYVNLKGAGWDVIAPYIWNCFVYFLLWLPVGLLLLKRKIRILKKKTAGISKETEVVCENV